MNIWKRFSEIEGEVTLLMDEVERTIYESLKSARDSTHWTQTGASVSDYDAVGLYGSSNAATWLTPSIYGGLSGKVSDLNLIIKEQGELIEQLAALLGKKITEPEESEYSKILVDGDAK